MAGQQGVQPTERDLPDVAAEIGDDREQRAQVHRDVERQTLVGKPEQIGREDQVGTAGYRQELGQALDQRQHQDLHVAHRPRSASLRSQFSELRAISSRSSKRGSHPSTSRTF